MKARTLREIQEEHGGSPHGYAIMIAVSMPTDKELARLLSERLLTGIDDVISEMTVPGELEPLVLAGRLEAYEDYLAERLPGSGN